VATLIQMPICYQYFGFPNEFIRSDDGALNALTSLYRKKIFGITPK
jgi:hypothetical protein